MSTLFGGLGAVLLLYAAGGLWRGLSPMLRAALAGAIPLAVYFILIVGRWPGLDVVAMHISVFLAAALVLFAFTQFRRRSSGRMHWAPKLLTAFFIGLVFLNAALLYIASNGLPDPIARWWLGSAGGVVHSGFSGVVPHGESAAKSVASELSETYRESTLGWQVAVSGLDAMGKQRPLHIRVADRNNVPVERVNAEVRLLRPGETVPVLTLPLGEAAPGDYLGLLTLPAGGHWLLELRLKQGDTLRYRSMHELAAS
jgi:nitrogen fixation protein FixH